MGVSPLDGPPAYLPNPFGEILRRADQAVGSVSVRNIAAGDGQEQSASLEAALTEIESAEPEPFCRQVSPLDGPPAYYDPLVENWRREGCTVASSEKHNLANGDGREQRAGLEAPLAEFSRQMSPLDGSP